MPTGELGALASRPLLFSSSSCRLLQAAARTCATELCQIARAEASEGPRVRAGSEITRYGVQVAVGPARQPPFLSTDPGFPLSPCCFATNNS